MDNQHKKILGYRDLTQTEIDAMNDIKVVAGEVEYLIGRLKAIPGTDPLWVAIGATDLQTGFMALTRSIAKPTTF